MTRTLLACACLLTFVLSDQANAQADVAKLFRGTGTVTATEPAGTVTLNHGPIEGLMPAMEMMFKLDPAAARARPGDRVEFRVDGRNFTIVELKVIGYRK